MTESDVAIRTENLGRRFRRNWAVRELNLEVPRGSVYGFLGLNGAGKSTTIRMLMGLLAPHTGRAEVLGIDPMRDDLSVKARVGYVAEQPYFYEWMTVEEIAAFVAHYRPDSWDGRRADHLIERFKLPRDQRLDTLSKGQKAKVSLLLAMAFNPEMLILDEPTGGLDPLARREFLEGILAEYMEGGQTILVSTHLINEVAGLVDHVGILVEGRLVRAEKAESLRRNLKRVRLEFAREEGIPEVAKRDGILRSWRAGRELYLVIDRYEHERHQAELREFGAERVNVEDLNLEDVFIELAGAELPGRSVEEVKEEARRVE